jgi:HEAT repeat protein
MTRATLRSLLVAAVGVVAAATTLRGDAVADKPLDVITDALSGIDYVPTQPELDAILDAPVEDLIAIAADKGSDQGIRIRAYRALALYPTAESETALRQAILDHSIAVTGASVIYLRAAMESLVLVAVADAVDALTPQLDHPSRDIRTAAARALELTGSAAAVNPLRARLAIEDIEQVRQAITKALRALPH